MPGLQARSSATVRWQPAPAAGSQPAPSGPTSAPRWRPHPSSDPVRLPSVPVRPGQAPIAARTTAGSATARPYRHRPSLLRPRRRHPWVSPCWRRNHPRSHPPTRGERPCHSPRAPSTAGRAVGRKARGPRSNRCPAACFSPFAFCQALRRTHPCAVGVRFQRPRPLTDACARLGVTPPPVVALASPAAAAVPVRQATPAPAKLLPPNLPSQPLRRKTGAAPRPRPSEPAFVAAVSAIHGALTTNPQQHAVGVEAYAGRDAAVFDAST